MVIKSNTFNTVVAGSDVALETANIDLEKSKFLLLFHDVIQPFSVLMSMILLSSNQWRNEFASSGVKWIILPSFSIMVKKSEAAKNLNNSEAG
jgi:hypothetical protein